MIASEIQPLLENEVDAVVGGIGSVVPPISIICWIPGFCDRPPVLDPGATQPTIPGSLGN